MVRILFISLSFICCLGSIYAVEIERKVIIQNNSFYYVSVDENHQMATLFTGSVTTPLKFAKALAVPAGRGISAQTNPLAWDIHKDNLYAINFIEHSLNDRNEAIKEIKIDDLRPWSTQTNLEELILKSVDYPMYTLNEPYLFTTKQSNFLNHFYFDAVFVGDVYWMVVANNGNLVIWKYENETWEHSEVLSFEISNYFSLFVSNNKLALITAEGLVYNPTLAGIGQYQIKSKITDLKGTIIVEDRDKGIVYTVNNGQLIYEKSLADILRDAGQKL